MGTQEGCAQSTAGGAAAGAFVPVIRLFVRCVVFGSVSVVSVRGRRAGEPGVVYIGRSCAGWRSSVLGNPFRLRSGASAGERRAVIRQYRVWLGGQLRSGGPVAAELRRLAGLVRAGESVVLGCWCSPLPCHGDVIRSAVLWLAEQGE